MIPPLLVQSISSLLTAQDSVNAAEDFALLFNTDVSPEEFEPAEQSVPIDEPKVEDDIETTSVGSLPVDLKIPPEKRREKVSDEDGDSERLPKELIRIDREAPEQVAPPLPLLFEPANSFPKPEVAQDTSKRPQSERASVAMDAKHVGKQAAEKRLVVGPHVPPTAPSEAAAFVDAQKPALHDQEVTEKPSFDVQRPGSERPNPIPPPADSAPLTPPVVRNVSTTTVPLRTATPETGRSVARQLAAAVTRTQDGATEVNLHPRELGQVRIHIAVVDQATTVTIQAERAETHALIRRHVDVFAQDLRDSGFASLEFDFGDAPRQSSTRQPGYFMALEEPSPEDVFPPNPLPQRAVALSGIDIRL